MVNRARRRMRADAKTRACPTRRSAASHAERQLTAARDLAFDMEEPLNQATCFVRVLEQTGGGDDEADAVAFVATEARLRLQAVQALWRKLLESAKAA